jgi:hypothetical protein
MRVNKNTLNEKYRLGYLYLGIALHVKTMTLPYKSITFLFAHLSNTDHAVPFSKFSQKDCAEVQ